MDTKTCSKCGETKPLEEFYKDKEKSSGCKPQCKTCEKQKLKTKKRKSYSELTEFAKERDRERNRTRYWKNLSYNKDKKRRWYLNNIEYSKEYARKHHTENKEARREKAKQYHLANCKVVREKKRQWALDNPEKRKAYRYARRARKLNNGPCMTSVEYESWEAAEPKECFYCGADCSNGDYHVDHIQPLSKGGTHQAHNLCIACKPCNLTKNDRDPEEFLEEILERA